MCSLAVQRTGHLGATILGHTRPGDRQSRLARSRRGRASVALCHAVSQTRSCTHLPSRRHRLLERPTRDPAALFPPEARSLQGIAQVSAMVSSSPTSIHSSPPTHPRNRCPLELHTAAETERRGKVADQDRSSGGAPRTSPGGAAWTGPYGCSRTPPRPAMAPTPTFPRELGSSTVPVRM